MRRPPALLVYRAPLDPHHLHPGDPVDSKQQGVIVPGNLHDRRGETATLGGPITVDEQHVKTINHVLEQPKLVWVSGFQPISLRAYHRFARTRMRTSPPLSGRTAFVGFMLNRYLLRNRMSGVITRQAAGAYGYDVPARSTGPRLVQLGAPVPARGRSGGSRPARQSELATLPAVQMSGSWLERLSTGRLISGGARR